ncbi:MAG: fibronectin type III domain-containing protein [Candidatus Hydrogenedentes bacterium]|nr:fibronectin type III domain-containing protein [Candidatus Hydrogenedentota bacterium]
MARFPMTESTITVLADRMIAGLEEYTTMYPTPPVSSAALEAAKTAHRVAMDTLTEARALYAKAVTDKNATRGELVAYMKKDLRYAENAVDGEDTSLKLLGWGAPRPKKHLQVPGQCQYLKAPREGKDWIYLIWKQPVDGGTVATYEIQRREAVLDSTWKVVDLSMDCAITLHDQPRGTEWEYRVLAVNKAGTSAPSGTVTAVL